MNIENSVNWNLIEAELRSKASRLAYRGEVNKLISNIGKKVSELSKAEVEARRGNVYRANRLLLDINSDIEMVEEYLLIAKLLG